MKDDEVDDVTLVLVLLLCLKCEEVRVVSLRALTFLDMTLEEPVAVTRHGDVAE